jgi:hypothetical protein
LSSVFTSAISITSIYINQISQSQILLIVYRIKFIAYYEIDEEIAEVYTKIYRVDKGEYTEKLLEKHEKSFK